MVNGEGSPIGPYLSNIGRELTLDQLRESLLKPDARVAPGYGLVSVGSVRGFARNRTSFELALHKPLRQVPLRRTRSGLSNGREALPDASRQRQCQRPTERTRIPEQAHRRTTRPHQTVQNSRRHTTTQTRRLADLQRKAQREPLQRPQGDQQGERQQARSEVDLLDSPLVAVPPRHSLLPREHALLRISRRCRSSPTASCTRPDRIRSSRSMRAPASRSGTTRAREPPAWSPTRHSARIAAWPSCGDNVFMVTDNAHLIAFNRITGRLVWEVVMWDEPQKYGGTVRRWSSRTW